MQKRTTVFVIIAAIGIFLISLVLFIGTFVRLHHVGAFSSGPVGSHWYRMHRKAPTITDVQSIEPWMTIAFLNKAFMLPSDYLKYALTVTDSRYPNILISTLAKENATSSNVYLETIRQTVTMYLESPK